MQWDEDGEPIVVPVRKIHLERYLNAVKAMDNFASRKKERVEALRSHWDGLDFHAREYLIDTDGEAAIWQKLRDRAAVRAAALGPAALLEAMGAMSDTYRSSSSIVKQTG
jgi:hypothetical protein